MTMTNLAGVSQRTALWAVQEMLAHAEPMYVLSKMGKTQPIPKNKASTAKFRRPVPFAASTVPLAEGVTPSAQAMAYEDVSVTLKQYGNFVTVTDRVEDEAEDPVLQNATELLGEQAGASVEQIIYNAVKGGTTVAYANGSARTDVNTPITLNKQRAIIRTLKRNKARKITKILASGPNYNTYAVEAAYVAVAHTDLEHDIRGLQGFTTVADYANRSPISEYEIGSVEDVRYVLSPDLAPFTDGGGAKSGSGTTMVSTTGTSADVYPILYFGMDAFGQVPLKGAYSLSPTVVPAKPSDSDPLGQRSHVGYKFTFAALILNESWMARLEVAATALS
jgi:N4-gp56 family major capsid protein